mgnify:CR=1 FL=1
MNWSNPRWKSYIGWVSSTIMGFSGSVLLLSIPIPLASPSWRANGKRQPSWFYGPVQEVRSLYSFSSLSLSLSLSVPFALTPLYSITEDPDSQKARQYWIDTGDTAGALNRMPKHLLIERLLLEGLKSLGETQYLNAFSRVRRCLLLK